MGISGHGAGGYLAGNGLLPADKAIRFKWPID